MVVGTSRRRFGDRRGRRRLGGSTVPSCCYLVFALPFVAKRVAPSLLSLVHRMYSSRNFDA